jgi:hypothetical protein
MREVERPGAVRVPLGSDEQGLERVRGDGA